MSVPVVERPPDRRSPPGEGGLREQRGMQSATILALHPQTVCAGCGIEFSPRRSWHRLCRTCFAWARVAHHVGAARRALGAT